MSDYLGSTVPVEDRDCWRTPIEIFTALDLEFGFYLDAAASRENTLCASYLALSEQDALRHDVDWVSHGAIWCNPPYSNIKPWIIKATEQCIRQRQTIVMLVPADISTQWFKLAMGSVDEIRLITDGRINFTPVTASGKKGSNPKGSMLLIWRPFITPRSQFTTVSKVALVEAGTQYLEEVQAQCA